MSHILDQAIEYTRAIGAVVMDQVAQVNHWVPNNETFGGDGLRWFIRDHEDHLAEVEEHHQDLVIMTDHSVQDLQITNQVVH